MSHAPNPQRLLREAEAAEILSVEVATLRRWRWSGTGPRFVKIGAAVRYEPDVLAQFIANGRRSSTSDPGQPIFLAGNDRPKLSSELRLHRGLFGVLNSTWRLPRTGRLP